MQFSYASPLSAQCGPGICGSPVQQRQQLTVRRGALGNARPLSRAHPDGGIGAGTGYPPAVHSSPRSPPRRRRSSTGRSDAPTEPPSHPRSCQLWPESRARVRLRLQRRPSATAIAFFHRSFLTVPRLLPCNPGLKSGHLRDTNKNAKLNAPLKKNKIEKRFFFFSLLKGGLKAN